MGAMRDFPSLRYRRFGGGYRRDDVEAALESLLSSVRTVEADLHALRRRSAQLEHELEAARAEVAAYRAREDELVSLLERVEGLLARAGRETAEALPAPGET